ncbi:MAG TPA: alpha/beta hydrolase domain-containing protein, partial [Bryobacteraceae bacterium]|nr:alpha/beta hydrolase domain-containing protein [Bryobacteraceae bacterium]
AAGKSRGTVFLEVVNRGGPQSLYLLDGARGGGPKPEGWDLGDDFLLKQGFTILFLGWEFDVPPGRGLGLRAPAAPVSGLVRESYVSLARGAGWKTFDLKYCAADPAEKDARLIYRHAMDETGQTIAREKWHFDDGGCAVTLDGGFDAGLYAAIYHAKDPAVAGLGLAAIRDFASYLKYGPAGGAPREDPAAVRRVIGYGYSQSGRVLRQFVRDGFNADERGREAFDGLMISSAGAGGASVNHRFAMPGEAGNSVLSILRPVDVPPFHDDELLAKVDAAHVTPRIFYTFSSTEYWARAGSLTTTTPDGSADVPLGPRSRLYFLTGTPHAAGPFPPRGPLRGEQYYANFAQQEWVTRALLIDLDAWIRSGTEPPRSRYPLVAKHELAPREAVRFPKSPAIVLPDYMPQVWRMDYGPEFASQGIISNEPPVLGAPYTVLVPQVDADGNDVGGVRLPEIAVPLGTFTGWNVRLPELRSLHFLAGLIGSFEPFPKTRAERRKSGDARRSIAERYAGRQDYLERVRGAAQALVRERLLLAGDVPAVMERAAAMWDAIGAN